MKVKKARITLLLLIITVFLIFFSNVIKPREEQIIDVVIKNDVINGFVQENEAEYNVTLLSVEELSSLKNSTQYAIYAGLSDKPVYRITVLDGNKGYLAFVDVQTNQIVDVIEVYNLQII